MKTLLLISLLLLTIQNSNAQNLVGNGNFENYTACPDDEAQVDRAIGWEMFCGTPDYLNSCSNNPFVSVPENWSGSYQTAASGDAYVGIFTYYSWYPWGKDLREHIAYQLDYPLGIGQKYFVSFKASLAINGWSAFCATNNIGAKFTTKSYSIYGLDSLTSPLVNNFAHIYTTDRIEDTLNWVTINGSFIADSNYTYLVIGNFFDDIHTDSMVLTDPVILSCQAYYYIDDVCVSVDSTICSTINNIGNVKSSVISSFQQGNTLCVTIEENTILDNAYIVVYDISGRLLKKYSINNYQINIDCQDLPKGFYFFRIYFNNYFHIQKIHIF